MIESFLLFIAYHVVILAVAFGIGYECGKQQEKIESEERKMREEGI